MNEFEQTMRDSNFGLHHAWWSGSLHSFRRQENEAIVERLNLRLTENDFLGRRADPNSWRNTLPVLRDATVDLPEDWQLLIEYPLLRLGHRIDFVLVSERAIFVLEFKSEAKAFESSAKRQVEDYALDLHYFHSGSRNHPVIPILVVNDANPGVTNWPLIWHDVARPVFEASRKSLRELLNEIISRIPHRGVDILSWETAAYRPVPNIVEAATMLYTKHGVADIAEARADTENLTKTTNVILSAVSDASKDNLHIIVFVTGIPGAGKTLCGLNTVFGADSGAAFLTGNLPLVHVLREALARDSVSYDKANGNSKAKRGKKGEAMRKAKQAIQGLTQFISDNIDRSEPPHEHVVVFDEAQRAWNAKYGAKSKFKRKQSEASIFLDIMARHLDFAVIVALVGNGQEINTGEAGLSEWGRALSSRPYWQVRAAPDVLTTEEPRQRLFTISPEGIRIDPALNLNVSIRAIRSPNGASWVDSVLRGNLAEAKKYAQEGVPFFITRSLSAMRSALRYRARGKRRAGLVCSSGAKRLVAEGIWPNFDHLDDSTVAHWFLDRWPDDVRASDALEIPATEFACQGLELDYVGLCWGGDLIWKQAWITRNFSGTRWHYARKQDTIDFCRNTYRVLLTRARYDTIIWVPEGDINDPTREPILFEQTVDYLLQCGATMLEEMPTTLLSNDREPTLL